ncbi:hypothetical protein M3629_02030 [Paenibacillus polysaccharolyticus]|uniref:hypothetical protein n=1 Tax=Paenibacillus polysaccharolyticus TaxID=582692 RepID=UPI00203F256E|nr:hypothetical protein [Paenibacillus polysaccharolyticus]MCM3131544.1 hypothetical protein [Paenibacillus polysaccharolyticus]
MHPNYKYAIYVTMLIFIFLLLVLYTDVRIPIEGKSYYSKPTTHFGMVLIMGITGLLGIMTLIGAMDEKPLVQASFMFNFGGWVAVVAIQFYRVTTNEELFNRLTISLINWAVLFVVIHSVFAFIFIGIEKKKTAKEREKEEEEKLKLKMEKIGRNYVFTFPDGSKMPVTQQDIYKNDLDD